MNKAQAPYPYMSINGEFLSKELLDAAWAQLFQKMPVWQAGLEQVTPAEQLAFYVLKQITLRMPSENNSPMLPDISYNGSTTKPITPP